jgi:hypothetical protein
MIYKIPCGDNQVREIELSDEEFTRLRRQIEDQIRKDKPLVLHIGTMLGKI